MEMQRRAETSNFNLARPHVMVMSTKEGALEQSRHPQDHDLFV